MAVTLKRYLKASDVLVRYQINQMTLWRAADDARLGFPQPVVIRNVRFFPEDELDAFDERRRVKTPLPFTKSTRNEEDFAAVIAAREGEAI